MSVHEDTAVLNFCIDNYEGKLVRKIHKLSKSKQCCDVVLVCNGVSVHTHRVILCAGSQYFATLFSDRWSPSVSHDVSHLFSESKLLEAFVSFMYTGKIKITNDNIDEILNAGTHLLVDDLRDVCSKYLVANLSPKNCLCIWLLAEKYHLVEVFQLCKEITISRFQDYLIHKESTLELAPDFLEKIVGEGVLHLVSQADRVRFLLKWQNHQEDRILSDVLLKYAPEIENEKYLSDLGVSDVPSDEGMDVDCQSTPPSPIHKKHLVTGKEEQVEAIFTFTYQACYINIYVYLRNHNQWRHLGRFNDNEFGFITSSSLVGFLGLLAIYDDGIEESCSLVDFQNKSVKSLKCPSNGHNSSRQIFCFNGKIMLLHESKCRKGNTSEIALFVLEPNLMEWQKELATEMTKLYPEYSCRTKISYSVITSRGKAYIWAQDVSSNTSGPFWMVLQPEASGKYVIQPLANPPVSMADLRILTPMSLRGWKHATFRLATDSHKIFVYRSKTLTSQTMKYDMLLSYDKETDSWTRKDNVVADIPKSIDVPVTSRQLSSGKTYVQLDQKCKVQSHLHGCTYVIEKACPFVARLWAHSLSDNSWNPMAPPPIENMASFQSYHIVSLARSVSNALQGTASFGGANEDSDHSPMVHWELDVKGRTSKIELQSAAAFMLQQCTHG